MGGLRGGRALGVWFARRSRWFRVEVSSCSRGRRVCDRAGLSLAPPPHAPFVQTRAPDQLRSWVFVPIPRKDGKKSACKWSKCAASIHPHVLAHYFVLFSLLLLLPPISSSRFGTSCSHLRVHKATAGPAPRLLQLSFSLSAASSWTLPACNCRLEQEPH